MHADIFYKIDSDLFECRQLNSYNLINGLQITGRRINCDENFVSASYGYVTNMNTNTGTASMKLLLSQGGFDNQVNESLLEFTRLLVFFPIDGIY